MATDLYETRENLKSSKDHEQEEHYSVKHARRSFVRNVLKPRILDMTGIKFLS